MELLWRLSLPRDAASVPMVRHLLRGSFRTLGVEEGCLEELELVVTEACTNVLKHAVTDDDSYVVEVRTSGPTCDVRVKDAGTFDHAARGIEEAQAAAEGGRGLRLMRLLVDRLQFVSEPSGTVVHLEKQLVLKESSPLRSTPVAATSPYTV